MYQIRKGLSGGSLASTEEDLITEITCDLHLIVTKRVFPLVAGVDDTSSSHLRSSTRHTEHTSVHCSLPTLVL